MLRFLGLIQPPPGSGALRRIGGILILLAVVAILLAIGTGIAMLIALPFGGTSTGAAIFFGLLIVVGALITLSIIGRKRQKRARAKAAAERSGK
jgi:hypothetical protein